MISMLRLAAPAAPTDPEDLRLARAIVARHERQTLTGQALLILRVLQAVAKAWGVGAVALVEPARARRANPSSPHPDKRPAVSRARAAAAMLLVEHGLSSRRVAQALELRSHAAVLRACRRAARLAAADWAFQRQLRDAREALSETGAAP